MRFHDPELLWLLAGLFPAAILLQRSVKRTPALFVGDGNRMMHLPTSLRARAAGLLPWLRLPVLALLVLALARPQSAIRETTEPGRTADVMIVLDLSTSMLAEDPSAGTARKNRITAAKEVLIDFLDKRPGDRAGLVVFAARPYSAAPLTLNHAWLKEAIARLQVGMVEDGTAVGDGLLAALNRLRNTAAGSRTVILITDGRSNTGTHPDRAAAAAAALGVRIHVIGIGSVGTAVFPTEDPLGGVSYRQIQADLDEPALRRVAETTGGRYFPAGDRKALGLVMEEIDKLEKRSVERKIYFSYRELFPRFTLAALLLFLTGQLLGRTLLRKEP